MQVHAKEPLDRVPVFGKLGRCELRRAKSGKTLLAEDMIFEAGITHRRGTIEGKNTVSDFHEIEHERENSVFATTMHTEWHDYKINIIDTPGFDDFVGEMMSSLRVADTCVMVINAQHGVEVGSELIWNYVDRFNKPVIFAINQVDHPKSNFEDRVPPGCWRSSTTSRFC
jgi:elongation factor G